MSQSYYVEILEAADQVAVLLNGEEIGTFNNVARKGEPVKCELKDLGPGYNKITLNGLIFTEKKGCFAANVHAPGQPQQNRAYYSQEEQKPGMLWNTTLSVFNYGGGVCDVYNNVWSSWSQIWSSCLRGSCNVPSSSQNK